ncbi:hypothetical protein [Nocardia asteroides]|uniref:hypothetical protein n=1 Tax=Nocardia asteroides TaxID=1824 RepID=UPI003B3ACEA7
MGPVPNRHAASRPVVDRRTALRAGAGACAGLLLLGAAAGCASDPVHDPDQLAGQEERARVDAAAATAMAATEPARARALATVAAERTAHADALRAEIARVVGHYGDGTTPVHRTRAALPAEPTVDPITGATGGSAAPPTPQQLRDRLTRSRRSAADLARTQTGYRAGLLASISAACAAHAEVLLA